MVHYPIYKLECRRLFVPSNKEGGPRELRLVLVTVSRAVLMESEPVLAFLKDPEGPVSAPFGTGVEVLVEIVALF